MKKNKGNRSGFTLVEIMIVVAIIGLLAAIAIPSFMKARERSLTNTKKANITQIESAIARYSLDSSYTNGASVSWENLGPYLRNSDIDSYTVGSAAIDPASLVVGGDVQYNES